MLKLIVTSLSILFTAQLAPAATYLLDAPDSPFSVAFSDSGARLTVTNKSDGFVWKNPDTGGGSTVTVNATTQSSATNLTANVTISGQSFTLGLELHPAVAELRVSLGGTNGTVGGGVVYPFPFFPTDGSGHAVVPVDSGYVVPVTNTTFNPSAGQRGMEWFGGTDANNARAWLALVDTPDDYELKVRTGTVGGPTRLGTAPNWRGSNNNPARNPNLLSYARSLRLRFLNDGGYVAMAKQFRDSAAERGWLKTLAAKKAENPSLDLDRFIGAPVCYVWGDGRSTALLDALTNAGISKALIQVSVNHVDQQKNFPATGLADRAWFDAVRAHGFLGGFYDIYAAVRSAGQGGSPYDGFYHLWPPTAWPQWLYTTSSNTLVTNAISGDVCSQRAAEFAAGTRLPAHISRFGLDANFFDVVCAVDLREDFDTNYGHFATRTIDRANRLGLLNSAFTNAAKRLLTGTEQGRSWAVPALHWTEGKFWLGANGTGLSDGSFNDNSYPQVMVDVVDPTNNGGSNRLAGLLSDGFQAPLWDLVFHDCLVTSVHWHRAHNKYLYAWDHADRWAMLRGQSPLLQLTHDGVRGLASRQPNQLTNAFGDVWSSRWTVMSNRFAQTFTNVCRWHERVGYLEMIDHRRLATDRSVQMTEFSGDGGLSGHGIVVNFGVHDGAFGLTNAPWTGTLRGQNLSVPTAGFQTYSWSSVPLRVEARVEGADLKLTWPSLPGERFTVLESVTLGDVSAWTALATNWPASLDGTSTSFIHPRPRISNSSFIRVLRP